LPKPTSFSYAAIRVVPRVEREEFLNCGVIVFSLERKFLGALIHPDHTRLQLLWPQLDLEETVAQLQAISLICQGAPSAGPIAKLPQRERFYWLVAPRSTVVQVSPVHTGLSTNPDRTLLQLFQNLCGTIG